MQLLLQKVNYVVVTTMPTSGKIIAGIFTGVERRSKQMLIEQMKKEIWFYAGKKATDQEAEEILGFAEDNPSASLDEIIQDYYADFC